MSRIRFLAAVLSLSAALVLFASTPLLGQETDSIVGPIVRTAVQQDVSPSLMDLMNQDSTGTSESVPAEAEPARLIPLPDGLKPASDPDSVLQETAAFAPPELAPSHGLSFEGLGAGISGFNIQVAPPDTNGAAGRTQYVQWVNFSFAVFDKATGNMIGRPLPGNSIWRGFGGLCESTNLGDPMVTYDKLADRWVLSQFAFNEDAFGQPIAPFLQCVAVSTTADATGTYNRYSFQYSNFDDYPKMGVWPDAYYVTFNMFNGNSFVGADGCAYDRNAMLAGLPQNQVNQICFQKGSSVGSLLPSDLDGITPPPAGSPNFLLFFGANNLQLFRFHVDFATPSNSTFTGPTIISVAPFTPVCPRDINGFLIPCVPQAGTTQQLDSLADRLMYRLAYRNFGIHESLVVNHSVAAGSGGGVRWYEIQNPSGTPVIAQQSTFAPDNQFRWMGSIAMDKAGDIGLDYSVSGANRNPSIAFTGHAASDPANTMQAETIIINGTGSQVGNCCNPPRPLTRWGDYSAMQIDPVDDCTFWYTQEYMQTTGVFNWHTRIANFKFPGCLADFSLSASPASVTISPGVSGSSTITVTPTGGFTGAVTLSASGLPSGVTANFSTNPTTSTSVVTFTTSATLSKVPPVTITGTSGVLARTTTVALAPPLATPTSGVAPLTVTFASGGHLDHWDFGDGQVSSSQTSIAHTYPVAGVYTATPFYKTITFITRSYPPMVHETILAGTPVTISVFDPTPPPPPTDPCSDPSNLQLGSLCVLTMP